MKSLRAGKSALCRKSKQLALRYLNWKRQNPRKALVAEIATCILAASARVLICGHAATGLWLTGKAGPSTLKRPVEPGSRSTGFPKAYVVLWRSIFAWLSARLYRG